MHIQLKVNSDIFLYRSTWVSYSCLCRVWYHDMVCNEVRFSLYVPQAPKFFY